MEIKPLLGFVSCLVGGEVAGGRDPDGCGGKVFSCFCPSSCPCAYAYVCVCVCAHACFTPTRAG
ncbi:unnamed protein product [Protopolystoma xenopodis]|uniref:Uncharacterized protein n=1 Tax=Protopolystoma xenopodis TaxID=117903 RepID=A0A3S4ZEG1_9PLAT|nr:unnamed protein product [Protopolystoma xenopodis]